MSGNIVGHPNVFLLLVYIIIIIIIFHKVLPVPGTSILYYNFLNLRAQKVKNVYERCGFDASSSPTTLYMLSDLEARLEDLLSDIAKMPEEYVAKAEKVQTYNMPSIQQAVYAKDYVQ